MASRRRSTTGGSGAAAAAASSNTNPAVTSSSSNNNQDAAPDDRGGSNTKQGSAAAMLVPDKFDLVADDFALEDSQEDQELKELERRLNTEVEEDLFEEPRKFKYVRSLFIT